MADESALVEHGVQAHGVCDADLNVGRFPTFFPLFAELVLLHLREGVVVFLGDLSPVVLQHCVVHVDRLWLAGKRVWFPYKGLGSLYFPIIIAFFDELG